MDFGQWVNSELKIKGLKLRNRLALAPMAGCSDLIYRKICHQAGSALQVTELVSARGIVYDPTLKRNYRYLEIDRAERPVAIQLFGHDPSDFKIAIARILKDPKLKEAEIIDLNAGCPVPKVVKTGAGAALMQDLDLLQRILASMKEALAETDKLLSIKFRSGFSADKINAKAVAKLAEAEGVDFLTIHPRTRDQMYRGRADWQVVKELVKSVAIPVFASGDVVDLATAQELASMSTCAGIMIGRAAQGNPWIFQSILQGKMQRPSEAEFFATIFKHLEANMKRYGELAGIKMMRSHFAMYFKGRKNSGEIKAKLMQMTSKEEIIKYLEEIKK